MTRSRVTLPTSLAAVIAIAAFSACQSHSSPQVVVAPTATTSPAAVAPGAGAFNQHDAGLGSTGTAAVAAQDKLYATAVPWDSSKLWDGTTDLVTGWADPTKTNPAGKAAGPNWSVTSLSDADSKAATTSASGSTAATGGSSAATTAGVTCPSGGPSFLDNEVVSTVQATCAGQSCHAGTGSNPAQDSQGNPAQSPPFGSSADILAQKTANSQLVQYFGGNGMPKGGTMPSPNSKACLANWAAGVTGSAAGGGSTTSGATDNSGLKTLVIDAKPTSDGYVNSVPVVVKVGDSLIIQNNTSQPFQVHASGLPFDHENDFIAPNGGTKQFDNLKAYPNDRSVYHHIDGGDYSQTEALNLTVQ